MVAVMRIKIVFYFISVISMILLGRVFFLSIKSNAYFEELSVQNYTKRIYNPSIRGVIKDRNGVALAVNQLGFSIYLKPHLVVKKNDEKLQYLANFIQQHFPDFDSSKIIKKYKNEDSYYNHDSIEVVDYIKYEDFIPKYPIFNAKSDIEIKTSYKREYPFKDVGAHIIGYVGKATQKEIDNNEMAKHTKDVGKSGLEKFYNNFLQGGLGYTDMKVNAHNEEVEVLDVVNPNIYNDLQISIDIRLQQLLHELFKGKSGAAVVMNIETGEILAAGSFPEIDNNLFANGISGQDWNSIINDPNRPFTNKLTNGLYPPGSVIKMGVALSFLENGLPADFSVYCNGGIQLGNRKFRCWKGTGHGSTDIIKAIRESCDVFFYEGSLKVGVSKVAKTLDELGIGRATGIDLPNEFLGINPSQEWKEKKYKKPWFIGETVVSSIGQGYFLATPLQIAKYTGAIVSERIVTPHFRMDANLTKNQKKRSINQTFYTLIKEGMYQVCNEKGGTATSSIKSKVKLIGKTGTAQVVGISQSEKTRASEDAMDYYHRSHAWFTSAAPAQNPKYVVTVLLEHGGHGGTVSAPIASKMFDKLLELGYINQP
jgi:penicillin-binding protein 2